MKQVALWLLFEIKSSKLGSAGRIPKNRQYLWKQRRTGEYRR